MTKRIITTEAIFVLALALLGSTESIASGNTKDSNNPWIKYKEAIQSISEEEDPKKCADKGQKLQHVLEKEGHQDDKLYIFNGARLVSCLISNNQLSVAEAKGVELIKLTEGTESKEIKQQRAYIQSSLGYIQYTQKNYKGSSLNYKSALDHNSKVIKQSDPNYKTQVVDVAKTVSFMEASMNDFKKSIETCKKYIPINLETDYYQCIGESYYRSGYHLFAEREALNLSLRDYKMAVDALQRIDDGSQNFIVDSLKMIAYLHLKLGQYSEIESVLLQAMEAQKRRKEPNKESTFEIARSLVEYYSQTGNFRKAETIQEKYLANAEIAGIDEDANTDNLRTLAFNAWMQDDLNKAEKLQRQVIELEKRSKDDADGTNTANSEFTLALILWKSNQIEESKELFVKSIAKLEQILPKYDYPLIHEYATLATFFFEQSDIEQSSKYAELSLNAQLRYITEQAPLLTRKQRINMLNSLGDLYKGSFTGADANSKTRSLAIQARINRHGILEEIEKNQYNLIATQRGSQSLIERLSKISGRLADKSLTVKERDSINKERLNIEAKLTEKIPTIKLKTISIEDVRQSMAPNSIFIAYQVYSPWNRLDSTSNKWKPDRYIALVITKAGQEYAIDIGSANAINNEISSTLSAIENRSNNADSQIKELSDKILGPISSIINGASIIYISPDSELNNVPFSALTSPTSSSRLEESKKIRIVTTARDIVSLSRPYKSNNQSSAIIANPDFGYSTATSRNDAITAFTRSAQALAEPQGGQWQALPGSMDEAEEVSKILNAKVYSGESATTANVKRLINSKILHIATHGYFMPTVKNKPEATRYSFYGWGSQDEDRMSRRYNVYNYSPLVNSGIVLAGANKNGRDGVLTALEISLLDMKNVELVVLSACDTLKGLNQFGQTSYGLRRALSISGARSSLLSLWAVDDKATAAFMVSFYDYLANGKSREDALTQTRRDFIKHPIPGWRHPNVWAAFQLSGDWRPIRFDSQ